MPDGYRPGRDCATLKGGDWDWAPPEDDGWERDQAALICGP